MIIPLPLTPKLIQKDSDRSAVFEIEGLYPGYGMTIGNALRRVLLSSLQGAAITSVKITGVPHEFSTIPGVMEDVVEITLNLKQVRVRMHTDEPQRLNLSVKGEKEINAKDIQAPSQVEIVTPDVHIATLTDKKSELDMELTVERGMGYQPVEQRKREKEEIGTIALDAIYTPVRRVSYEVENMRVGERTDYNRLRLHLETDGSMSPEEAMAKAAQILVDHFAVIASPPHVTAETPQIKEAEAVPSTDELAELALSARTANALKKNGVSSLAELQMRSKKELEEFAGLGKKGIEEIVEKLKERGLSLKEDEEAS